MDPDPEQNPSFFHVNLFCFVTQYLDIILPGRIGLEEEIVIYATKYLGKLAKLVQGCTVVMSMFVSSK